MATPFESYEDFCIKYLGFLVIITRDFGRGVLGWSRVSIWITAWADDGRSDSVTQTLFTFIYLIRKDT
jgi:hypothetical protein